MSTTTLVEPIRWWAVIVCNQSMSRERFDGWTITTDQEQKQHLTSAPCRYTVAKVKVSDHD